eukprot:CAMPEP_0197182238 /NCGR_PEP_ID=MMETSP1423-20130617/6262_1 /TAXON_ID=476441 /ORGANISM="Pseudo-nitzschia heimii, Strain UNC1101" /LENGTH=1365 /DNA_ID=CAMNT_0042632627 /DNA_START=185 /DNA_END=4282 /DNA_ORIENTATION=-
MTPSLNIDDPVLVKRELGKNLEGVVAFLGQVDFNKDDDWVGVRLTGSSVGSGKNNGVVRGKRYFDCHPACGIFVKASAISKRQLSRLEELKLRRELASRPGGVSKPVSKGTPSRRTSAIPKTPKSASSRSLAGKSSHKTSSYVSPKPTPTSKTSSPSTVSSATSSRIEEIRQRRAKLQSEGNETKSSDGTELTEKTQELQIQLDAVQTELSRSQEDNKEYQNQIKFLEKELKSAVAKPATPKKQNNEEDDAANKIAELQAQVEDLERKLDESVKAAKKAHDEIQTKYKQSEVDLAAAKAQVTGLEEELNNRDLEAEDITQNRTSETNHYKERAKLQAEVASFTRRVEQLEQDKQELEHNVEDLALDKEQLAEEKEALEDRLEEIKLDSETAQMELEEAKMELEDARSRIDSGIVAAASAGIASVASGDSDAAGDQQQAQADLAHNLSIQNARMREALIRLREQSQIEKMDLTRQLRTAEKHVDESTNLATQVESLRETNKELEEQISDLKDMVEQGSAYEIMVEDLSDRVLSLEEELSSSLQIIREMEEAADITAEMEEVQTEELKALNRDMEDREAIIRNLEEAIKMQRKREDDFQRTVSNYRKSVETLKQEKNALYELHQGGEGEKSDLASASQKALARAAQLVQDAAEMRKREAQAAIDRIDSQVRMHLSNRLESMLPASVAASEIASIKGELLLSKVVGKSSLSLDGIARSFAKTIRAKSWEWRSNSSNNEEKEEKDDLEENTLDLTDEQQEIAATMIHQSEVAHVAIDVSGDLLWLLSAGQWPDILSTEASSELGAIMGHSMNELDIVLGTVLNTLKEEGVLSPHQSNIGAFRQTVVTTMQTLRSHIEQDGESLVPMDWKPNALRLFRDASRAKYSSLGCYAAVASILNTGDAIKSNEEKLKAKEFIATLKPLLKKLDQAASEAAKSCLRLAKLDVLDETIVSSLSEAAEIWRVSSDDLLGNVYNMLLAEDGLTSESVGACEAATDEVVRVVSHFATVLRSANLTDADDNKFHPFSPEIADVWEGVTMLAKTIRSKDGDEDDVNYLVRAKTIENSLEDAVESVPELSLAKTKMSSLEKSLALRSKEISMQNARLSDLEKMLARSNAQPASRLVASQASSEEVKSLKQENRYLSEAMDVLHRQVEEYENEIRARDSKTPTKTRRPRRSFTPESRSSSRENLREGDDGIRSAFEAALFRPALQAARRDAAQWKTKATINTLLELPPLKVSIGPTSFTREEEKSGDGDMDPLFQLSSSLSSYQRETASVRLVDITKSNEQGVSPRMQLHQMMLRKAAASQEVDKATAVARHWLESRNAGVPKMKAPANPLLGRVKFAGPEPVRTIATSATGEDLYRIQLNLVK